MKKYFILIGLFLTLGLSGQVLPGVVAAQNAGAVAATEMVSNSDFSSGGTDWTVTAEEWDFSANTAQKITADGGKHLVQASGDMITSLSASTDYTFSITALYATEIRLWDDAWNVLIDYTNISAGTTAINFSTGVGGAGGIRVTFGGGTTTVTKISIMIR
jgi:hypothetical protein